MQRPERSWKACLWARRPGAGFLAIALVHCAAAALVAWGMQTPPLDRAWTIEHELKAGMRFELKDEERSFLAGTFEASPGLASGMLDGREVGILTTHRDGWNSQGHAVVARVGGPAMRVGLEVEAVPDDYPIRVRLSGSVWSETRTVESNGVSWIQIPASAADVIDVEIAGHRGGETRPAFKLSFEVDS